MGNKFVKELVFLGLVILPVYEISILVDAFILNTLEFWTGSNPMALKPGDNVLNINGQSLTVNVQSDRIQISDETGKILNDIQFNSDDNSWYSVLDGKSRKLMTINEETVQLYTMSGNMIEVSKSNISSKSTWMLLNEYVAAKYVCIANKTKEAV